ncbi:MAG: glycosyltransferase [Candidatus Omnitrophica bacterium]|nr:glycosyltransferase [Candidatus Omnitrophota bacterium]
MKKRVLFVIYNFPPINSPGIYRILGFLRNLPQDIEKYVLTAKNPFGDTKDITTLKLIPPDTKIYRTFSFEVDRMKTKLVLFFKKFQKKSISDNKVCNARSARKTLLNILESLIFFPDRKIGWLPTAFLCLFYLVLTKKIDIIFSSSPTTSSHLLGLCSKKFLKRRWIADFRDYEGEDYNHYPLFFKKIYFLFESCLFKNADLIIANTNNMKSIILTRHRYLEEDKIKVITNGYDSDILNANIIIKKDFSSVINITFVGTVYQGMLDTLYIALKDMFYSDKEILEKIRINLVGTISEYDKEVISKEPFRQIFNIVGFLPSEDINQTLASADILLLLQRNDCREKWCIPSKVFTYMFFKKPILAILPSNETVDLLRNTGLGINANFYDIDSIKTALKQIVCNFSKGNLLVNINIEEIEKYDRKVLTLKLFNFLNTL